MLRMNERLRGDVMVLDIRGSIQAGGTGRMLGDKINSLVQRGYRKLLFNLDGVTAVDSQGFGVFLMARGTVALVRGHIALMRVTKPVSSLLAITCFPVFDSEEQALVWFSTVPEGQVEVAGRPGRQAPAVAGSVSDQMQAQR